MKGEGLIQVFISANDIDSFFNGEEVEGNIAQSSLNQKGNHIAVWLPFNSISRHEAMHWSCVTVKK